MPSTSTRFAFIELLSKRLALCGCNYGNGSLEIFKYGTLDYRICAQRMDEQKENEEEENDVKVAAAQQDIVIQFSMASNDNKMCLARHSR